MFFFLDRGPEDVHTDDILDPGLDPDHTGDDQRADHILQNIGGGGAEVTRQCLIGGGIMVAGYGCVFNLLLSQ